MKKINSLKELRQEQRRIKLDEAHLEGLIRKQWNDFKKSATPSRLSKDTLNYVVSPKAENNGEAVSMLKQTLIFGATLLAKKVADLVESKISNSLK